MKTKKNDYKIIKDSREQDGWLWPNREVEIKALKTGDYTIEGYENIFVIERKASVSEIAKNITEARFTRELARLKEFAHAYLFLEFSVADILSWPASSNIPRNKQRFIKMRGPFILKRLMEYTLEYGIQIIFAGDKDKAQDVASSLFKRVQEKYGKHGKKEDTGTVAGDGRE